MPLHALMSLPMRGADSLHAQKSVKRGVGKTYRVVESVFYLERKRPGLWFASNSISLIRFAIPIRLILL
jgi:hypothetical protein